jgi:hypothetical protein
MVCETIDLFSRRRIHGGLGRLPTREVAPSKGNKVLVLTDYRARRKAICEGKGAPPTSDSDNDDYEDFTLFP